jgi:hypothetical protein
MVQVHFLKHVDKTVKHNGDRMKAACLNSIVYILKGHLPDVFAVSIPKKEPIVRG